MSCNMIDVVWGKVLGGASSHLWFVANKNVSAQLLSTIPRTIVVLCYTEVVYTYHTVCYPKAPQTV